MLLPVSVRQPTCPAPDGAVGRLEVGIRHDQVVEQDGDQAHHTATSRAGNQPSAVLTPGPCAGFEFAVARTGCCRASKVAIKVAIENDSTKESGQRSLTTFMAAATGNRNFATRRTSSKDHPHRHETP